MDEIGLKTSEKIRFVHTMTEMAAAAETNENKKPMTNDDDINRENSVTQSQHEGQHPTETQ